MPNQCYQYHTLRLVLGDQLNPQHSWFQHKDDTVLYVIAELHQEAHYVRHHIQKLCAFFAAMENFANALQSAGHQVCYLTLDETIEDEHLPALLMRIAKQYGINQIDYQRPDEYRLSEQLHTFSQQAEYPVRQVDSEHFLLPYDDIPSYFSAATTVRMEAFYRKMRQRFGVLMTDEKQPEGGQWNFDSSNRQKLKKTDLATIPEPLLFANDISHILKRIEDHQIPFLGKANTMLLWPTNRQQAKALLSFFCEHLLMHFGRFQDAMTDQSAQAWSLYHSRLSFAMNTKMLHPMHVIQTALQAYHENPHIDIAQIEGFIRQILGWREYVRGMYWINMPNYKQQNALQATKPLPAFFWHGKTKMHCLSQAINQSLDYAYAHHIQRLMVTGNFALLAGIDPQQVDDWYLGIYIDAIEWVELPNTRGMSQFADGGWVASKPYAASGNYTQKMSDYCSSCHYQVKQKTAENACPFNSLYWHFINKHRERLSKNPRIGMIYGNWDKQSQADQQAIIQRASWCLDNLNSL